MMISKILVIADASKEALELVLDTFQTIRKHQPKVRGIFISCLSESLLNNLGPNILNLLLKEEKETLEGAENYFTCAGIPHHFQVIASPWQTILDEIKVGDLDLIILQGEFLKICRQENVLRESRLHAVTPKCPIPIINESEKPSSTLYFLNLETLSKEGANSTWKD